MTACFSRRYAQGNLIQSELMGKNEHYEIKDRVEKRSVAAVQTALRARRVAASIQVVATDMKACSRATVPNGLLV